MREFEVGCGLRLIELESCLGRWSRFVVDFGG